MENNTIQLGFDIATSISIIGASISFLISQTKNKKQKQIQFSIDNLKNNLIYIANSKKEYDRLGNELREQVNNIEKSKFNEILHEHKLKQIFFLEDLKRELESQINIYYPIFFPDKKIISLMEPMNSELDAMLEMIKKDDNNFLKVLEQIEPFLNKLEKLFAESLIILMND